MGDYSNVIDGMFNQGPKSLTTSNIGVNPDQSARAYELEQATGVPSSIINGDIDTFEQQHKTALASDIVGANPYISDYVNSHPMAAGASNDDWGQLDNTISQHLQGLRDTKGPMLGSLEALWQGTKGVVASMGDAFTHAGDDVPTDKGRLYFGLQAGLNNAVALGSSLINAPVTFLHDYAQAYGGDKAGEAVGGALEGVMANMVDIHGPEMQAAERAGIYLKSGEMPPNGVHPLIDKAKVEANQQALDILDSAVKEAQSSTTKERAPELFQNFVLAACSRRTDGDFVGTRSLEMYGDKVPDPR